MRGRRRRPDGERGAALVEFALILPLFMMLVLGMFSGGIAYNQKLSMSHAAREGARYGATLSKAPPMTAVNWTAAVRDRVLQSTTGDLGITCAGPLSSQCTVTPGHFLCVALVQSDGTVDGSFSQQVGTMPAGTPGNCYADGLSDSAGRVHVLIGRPGRIEALLVSVNRTMTVRGTARYEV